MPPPDAHVLGANATSVARNTPCFGRKGRSWSEGEARVMIAPLRCLCTWTASVLFVAACFLSFALAQTSPASAPSVPGDKITTIPSEFNKNCRRGRAKLYDECSDQSLIFEAAKQLAAAENKVLLVSYGAEWCIWCHVFAKYIHGERTRFESTAALTLRKPDRYRQSSSGRNETLPRTPH